MEDEDLQMIEAVLQGNQPAFQQLVERYQHFVFTIALRIVKSREEAEEVAQDVFLKVYKTLGQFEKKSKFSTWLYTVAWRTSIDQARRKQILTDSIDDEEGAFWQIATPDETPLQAVQHSDLQQQLQQAIQQLRPDDAALITLYYLNEKSVKEIADITGLTETNIKTKLYRTRELLREYLDAQLQEEIKDML
ncbi:MAG TPA: sigma-70 family RNA polymerase sigma factor [Saprospiraceae bacterium]|nr:sigma-70 family RNA polymerase sigma factor [Saprospiraceae bacterium]HMP22706.1 sigma-70 family RNA polymerase sigma factor [Saprospiraceae bacterium]